MARTVVSTAGGAAGGTGNGNGASNFAAEEVRKLIQMLAAEKTALSAALQEVCYPTNESNLVSIKSE